MALVFIRSVCFATKAFNSSLFAKSAAKDSLICAFRSRLSSDWLSLYAFSKRSLRVSGGDSFVGDYCSVVLTTRLVEYSKKSQKILDEQMFVCYNTSEKICLQGFSSAVFQERLPPNRLDLAENCQRQFDLRVKRVNQQRLL